MMECRRRKKEREERKKCTNKENSCTCTEDTAPEPAHALEGSFTRSPIDEQVCSLV
jgi:hypothetical protein